MDIMRNPRRLALLYFATVTLVYFILARPVEYLNDFEQHGDHIFCANGPAGMAVLDAVRPPDGGAPSLAPVAWLAAEDGFTDIVLKKQMVKDKTVDIAYLADGPGVMVAQVADALRPRRMQYLQMADTVQDVAVWQDYLYVALGRPGVKVFKIKENGEIEAIKDGQFGRNVWTLQVIGDRLFLSENSILRVYYPGETPEKPQLLGSKDVGDTINGIAVYDMGDYQQIYLAADGVGVVGLQVSNSITATAEVTLDEFMRQDTPGEARGLFRFNQFLLVADGTKGLRVFDITDFTAPEMVKSYDTWGLSTGVWMDTAARLVYLADGLSGLRAIEFSLIDKTDKQADTPQPETHKEVVLKQVRVYETPGTASAYEVFNAFALRTDFYLRRLEGSFKMIGLGVPVNITKGIRDLFGGLVKDWAALLGTPWPETGMSSKALASLNRVFWLDFVFFGLIGIFLSGAFFIQFVLPVKGPYQRYMAARRMLAYLLMAHGSMARVNNATIEHPDGDENWRGPGVALVDLASAVVLEKFTLHRIPVLQLLAETLNKPLSPKDPYGGRWVKDAASPNGRRWVSIPPNRVAGPGLVFTNGNPLARVAKWDERVWRAVDLRKQVRTSSDLVPAHTRDGIETKNRIISVFSASEPPEVLLVTYVPPRERIAPGRWPAVSLLERLRIQKAHEPGAGTQSLQGSMPLDQLQRPEHLRVVQLSYRPVSDTQGYYRRMVVIKDFSDELDPDDQRQIHEFVQRQRRAKAKMTKFSEQALIELSATGEGPYAFDRGRVMAAAAARADRDQQYTEWHELPERAGVETYLNMLARQVYDDLYRPTDPNDYPLPKFKGLYGKAMRNQGVLSFQYISTVNGTQLEAGQKFEESDLQVYPATALNGAKVLRARGIKVIFAGFTEMNPVNEKVRDQFVNIWRARWQKHAEMTRSEYELGVMHIRHEARMRTQHDMLLTLWNMINTVGCSQEALALRLFQALEAVGADPLTRQFMPEETVSLLRMMHGWMTPRASGGSQDNMPISGPPGNGLDDLLTPQGPEYSRPYPGGGDTRRGPQVQLYPDPTTEPPVPSFVHAAQPPTGDTEGEA